MAPPLGDPHFGGTGIPSTAKNPAPEDAVADPISAAKLFDDRSLRRRLISVHGRDSVDDQANQRPYE